MDEHVTSCDSCGKSADETTKWTCVTNAEQHLHACSAPCVWKLEQRLKTAVA